MRKTHDTCLFLFKTTINHNVLVKIGGGLSPEQVSFIVLGNILAVMCGIIKPVLSWPRWREERLGEGEADRHRLGSTLPYKSTVSVIHLCRLPKALPPPSQYSPGDQESSPYCTLGVTEISLAPLAFSVTVIRTLTALHSLFPSIT